MRPNQKVLLLRYGGIGDMMPLTVVAHELKRRGWASSITVGCRDAVACVWENNPDVDTVLPIARIAGLDCFSTERGHQPVSSFFHEYDWVLDYKNTIENNVFGDHANWTDVALGYARLDPTTVPDKRPIYCVTDAERAWAQSVLDADGVQPGQAMAWVVGGSSMLRTWRQWPAFAEAFHARFPHIPVYAFGDARHQGSAPPAADWCRLHLDDLPLRHALALLAQCGVCLSLDSGFLHVAEALGLPTVGLFTTVRGWTRAAHYSHVTVRDDASGCPEGPCCSLDTYCPLSKRDLDSRLTPKQRHIWELAYRGGQQPEAIQAQMQMHPPTFYAEFNYIVQQHDATTGTVPACVASHTVGSVLDQVAALAVCQGVA